MQVVSNRAISVKRALTEVLVTDKDIARHLDPMSSERLMEPRLYLSEADAVIDRMRQQAEATFAR